MHTRYGAATALSECLSRRRQKNCEINKCARVVGRLPPKSTANLLIFTLRSAVTRTLDVANAAYSPLVDRRGPATIFVPPLFLIYYILYNLTKHKCEQPAAEKQRNAHRCRWAIEMSAPRTHITISLCWMKRYNFQTLMVDGFDVVLRFCAIISRPSFVELHDIRPSCCTRPTDTSTDAFAASPH